MLLLPTVLLPGRLLFAGQGTAEREHRRKVLLKTMDDTPTIAEDVWHALSDELRAFLRSRVSSEADADDLLQDVFVRVVEKIGSLRQVDRIQSWVYQIARNAIADFYRRHMPRPAGSVEDVADLGAPGGADNQNRAVGSWLSLMIDRLPQTLRDAVRMYEIEGLSQAEIATRLSISLSGAKSRIQRGRRQLEQSLHGCCRLELDRRGNVIECKPASGDCPAQASCECDEGS